MAILSSHISMKIVFGCCLIATSFTTSAADDPVGTLTKIEMQPAAANYKIDDLGELVKISDDVTVSLNLDGTVAYWSRVDGTLHATLWGGGHATVVDAMSGYPNMIAHAINRESDVAGWMTTSNNPVDSTSTVQGFIRHGNRIRTVIGFGGRDTRVLGLNDKGVAVGVSGRPDGTRHAFVLSRSGTDDLGTLPSGGSSTAYAINNAGLIVGTSELAGQLNHAVSWSNGKIVDLGTFPHGANSGARAVNSRGQIAGFSDSLDGTHAFLHTDGAMQDLGTLGSDPSEASGINNRGDVVGASNISGTKRHAFLWRDGRMVDLNLLISKDSKWTLLNAFSINDRGQIVVSGRRSGDAIHLLLLTPPM